MGCCASAEKIDDKNVRKELEADKREEQNVKKLLFLGSGGSGKSTLFKQLRSIHGEGFLDKDRMGFKDHIYSQVIDQMKLLVESMEDLIDEEPENFGDCKLSTKGEEAAKFIDYVRSDADVDDQVADAVELLWIEDSIKKVFEHRSKLKIDDSSEYFFNCVRRIATRAYIPTDKDILMVRHRTTGVIDQKFTIKSTSFHIFDVGGQRSERKKWIHCFEHVTAVIFVASLSCYDETMFEDDDTNSMIDSLELFEEICNLRWFIQTAIILFLNKKDLFSNKIKKIPINVCFPEYNGGDSYDECANYIKKQFENKNNNPKDKQIYSHMTCATDKSNVEKVFGDVQHIVINTSLVKGGLI